MYKHIYIYIHIYTYTHTYRCHDESEYHITLLHYIIISYCDRSCCSLLYSSTCVLRTTPKFQLAPSTQRMHSVDPNRLANPSAAQMAILDEIQKVQKIHKL